MSRSTLWVLWTPDCSFQSARSPRRAAGVTSSQKLGMETTLNQFPIFSTSQIHQRQLPSACLESKTTSRNLWKFRTFIDAFKNASNFCQRWIILEPRIMVKLKNCRQANLEVWSFGAPHFPLAVQSVVPTYLGWSNADPISQKTMLLHDILIYIYIDSKFKCWWYMHWY